MTSAADDDVDARWPEWHRPALRWVAALDARLEQLGHPFHRSFGSIINALEIQFEEGASPAAVRHLLRAFLATAHAARVAPTAFGLDDDPDLILGSIAPKRGARGGR